MGLFWEWACSCSINSTHLNPAPLLRVCLNLVFIQIGIWFKIVKICAVDPEIPLLREIFKKRKKRKKLTQAKHIAKSASLPSGLNKKTEP